MHRVVLTIRIVATICIAVLLLPSFSDAEKKIGTDSANPLNMTNSARANAMGGCVINLVDAESSFSNPAAPGLFYLKKAFAISFPSNTNLHGYRFKTHAVGFGTSNLELGLGSNAEHKSFWCMGFSYSHTRLEAGQILRTGHYYPYGIDPGTPYFSASDRLEAITVGFGFAIRHWRAGLGHSARAIEERLEDEEANGVGHDLGVIVECDILDVLGRQDSLDSSARFTYNLTPSIAIVGANMGGDMTFIEKPYPLPTHFRFGLSVNFEIKDRISTLFSAMPVVQSDRQPGAWTSRVGLELGGFGIFCVRAGLVERTEDASWGFGISLRGILDRTYSARSESETGFFNYILRKIDISYDFARAFEADNLGTGYHKLNLSL
jgi:hypothetical protein